MLSTFRLGIKNETLIYNKYLTHKCKNIPFKIAGIRLYGTYHSSKYSTIRNDFVCQGYNNRSTFMNTQYRLISQTQNFTPEQNKRIINQIQNVGDNIVSQQKNHTKINIKSSGVIPKEINKQLIEQNKPKKSLMEKTSVYCREIGVIMLHIVISPTKGWKELCIYFHPTKENVIEWFKEFWKSCKVFGGDMKQGYRLSIRRLQGYELTRHELRKLKRAKGDALKMIPFSIFCTVPGTELIFPFYLIYFPNMLPSSFQTPNIKNNQEKRFIEQRVKNAHILQERMENILNNSLNIDTDEKKKHINDFLEIIKKCKEDGVIVNRKQIISISEMLKEDLSLDNMNKVELNILCKYLNKTTLGFNELKRVRIRKTIKKIRKDDKLIMIEGVKSMSYDELADACKERGMSCKGLSKESLEELMEDWLDLSIYHKVPIPLLLLSRSFEVIALPENIEKKYFTNTSKE